MKLLIVIAFFDGGRGIEKKYFTVKIICNLCQFYRYYAGQCWSALMSVSVKVVALGGVFVFAGVQVKYWEIVAFPRHPPQKSKYEIVGTFVKHIFVKLSS